MIKALICILLGGLVSNNYNSDKIQCFKLSNVIPLIDMSGKIMSYDTGVVKLYYYGKKRMYDLQYKFDSVVDGKSVFFEIRHHQLVFTKGSTYGFDFDINRSPAKKIVNIDSMLKNEWIILNKIYPVLTNNISELKYKKINKKSGTVTEYYSLKDKKDSSETGSCMFTFREKIPVLDVSLSKELDSIKGMRLVKTQIVSFERFVKKYKLTLQKFEMLTEIKQIPVHNEKNILLFFSNI